MKRKLLLLVTILTLMFGSTLTVNAAGFVPVQEGSTVGYYFVDEANTQYYADGLIIINNMIYGFMPNGLTDLSTAIPLTEDKQLLEIINSYPAKVLTVGEPTAQTLQPIPLSNGVWLDPNPVACYNGTFQLTGGKVSSLKGVGFTQVSLKFNYDGNSRLGKVCYVGLYDSEGFQIGTTTISATKKGENTSQIIYNNSDVAFIALIPVNF